MATGTSTFQSINSLVADIYSGALFTLRGMNSLVNTVTVFNDTTGWNPRKLTSYSAANPGTVAEGAETSDVTAFNRSLTKTINPYRVSDRFLLTDQRLRTDPLNVRADAAMELGQSFATYVDTAISAFFDNLTGGTIGSAGGTLTWANIIMSKAKLRQLKVPEPYFCVLGEGQWYHLMNSVSVDASSFANAPGFNDRILQNYYNTTLLGGVTFVVTPNVQSSGGTAVYGAMYSPRALVYDERLPFGIEPDRKASQMAWEINANMEFAADVWAANRGIQLLGTDVIA